MYLNPLLLKGKWAWFDLMFLLNSLRENCAKKNCVGSPFSCIHAYWLLHCSLHSFLEIRIVIIVIKEKKCALRHSYQTHAKARIMSEIEEVQEQMKTDMEAMKEKITIMMEAMMSMRKMIEVNTATVVFASTATTMDSIHPSGFN